jgi:hypothetical protein
MPGVADSDIEFDVPLSPLWTPSDCTNYFQEGIETQDDYLGFSSFYRLAPDSEELCNGLVDENEHDILLSAPDYGIDSTGAM